MKPTPPKCSEPEPSELSETPPSVWRKVLAGVGRLAVIGLGLIVLTVLAGWVGGAHRYLEYTCHLRAQMLAVSVLALPVTLLMLKRRGVGLALGGAAVLLCLLDLLPLLMPGRAPAADAPRVRACAVNVYTANRHTERVIAFLREEQPDVVALQEVNAAWRDALEALADLYPTRYAVPREDNFGIALFLSNRCEATSITTRYFGTAGVPSIEAEVVIDGQALHIVATHPLPPVSDEYFSHRNSQFADLARHLVDAPPQTLLLGDLNITPFAPRFRRFLTEAELLDARAGFGVNPTWPTHFPWPCRIPIDTVLHGGGLDVADFRTGPDVGSDHLPVVADLAFSCQSRPE